MAVAAAFLQEATVHWTTFTGTDIDAAYEHLIHYEPLDWVYDEWEEGDEPPNAGNAWHPLLQIYALTETLSTVPGICPPSIPFY
jgi:hypothetical protein